MRKNALIFIVVFFLFHPSLWARHYLELQEYTTPKSGESAVSFWTDLHNPASGPNHFSHRTEAEVGLSDHIVVSLVASFIEGAGFSSLSMESRFRLGEPGSQYFDKALFLEIKDANGRNDTDDLEFRFIISKEFGSWNLTINEILIYENKVESDGSTKWGLDPAFAIGTRYKNNSKINPSLELLAMDDKSKIVPGALINLTDEIELLIGVGIGIASKADDYQLKSNIEFEF